MKASSQPKLMEAQAQFAHLKLTNKILNNNNNCNNSNNNNSNYSLLNLDKYEKIINGGDDYVSLKLDQGCHGQYTNQLNNKSGKKTVN